MNRSIRILAGTALAALAALPWCAAHAVDAGSAVGAAPLALGVPQSVTVRPDAKRFFVVDVPAGAGRLDVGLAGDNGEADLYVSAAGQPVSFSHYSCAGLADGSNESCTFYAPAPGRYTVLVYDGFQGTRDAVLTAATGPFTEPEAAALEPGQPLKVSGLAGQEQTWRVAVPDGRTRLLVAASGGRGSPGLSMRYEAIPDANANSCGLQCDQGFPRAGAWYVKLRGDEAFSGVTLLATLSQPGPLTPLVDGTTLGDLAGSCCEMSYYRFTVPDGAGRLTVATAGGQGDVQLYVGRGEVPSWWRFDCASDQAGVTTRCVLPSPEAGEYTIGLRSFGGYQGVGLTATLDMTGRGWHGGDCAPGSAQRTGTLYRGQAAHFPYESAGGRAGARLQVSTDGLGDESFPLDFDLYLERLGPQGWEIAGSSAGTSSSEEHVGIADAPRGRLRWTVAAFEGGGAYRLCAAADH